jgi:hypothetical protein
VMSYIAAIDVGLGTGVECQWAEGWFIADLCDVVPRIARPRVAWRPLADWHVASRGGEALTSVHGLVHVGALRVLGG